MIAPRPSWGSLAIAFAWWTGVDQVEAVERVRHGVGLDELVTAVMRLRFDVHADDVEARSLVALSASPCSCKKVKQDWFCARPQAGCFNGGKGYCV